jgi:hypothetical protein
MNPNYTERLIPSSFASPSFSYTSISSMDVPTHYEFGVADAQTQPSTSKYDEYSEWWRSMYSPSMVAKATFPGRPPPFADFRREPNHSTNPVTDPSIKRALVQHVIAELKSKYGHNSCWISTAFTATNLHGSPEEPPKKITQTKLSEKRNIWVPIVCTICRAQHTFSPTALLFINDKKRIAEVRQIFYHPTYCGSGPHFMETMDDVGFFVYPIDLDLLGGYNKERNWEVWSSKNEEEEYFAETIGAPLNFTEYAESDRRYITLHYKKASPHVPENDHKLVLIRLAYWLSCTTGPRSSVSDGGTLNSLYLYSCHRFLTGPKLQGGSIPSHQ